MASLTVECIACWWEKQRARDPLATVHQNSDGSWSVAYSDGRGGPATFGRVSNDPRMCICGYL